MAPAKSMAPARDATTMRRLGKPMHSSHSSGRACPCHAHLPLPCPLAPAMPTCPCHAHLPLPCSIAPAMPTYHCHAHLPLPRPLAPAMHTYPCHAHLPLPCPLAPAMPTCPISFIRQQSLKAPPHIIPTPAPTDGDAHWAAVSAALTTIRIDSCTTRRNSCCVSACPRRHRCRPSSE